MQIKITFNNESISKQFPIGWGFSCFVDGHILFDTGENSQRLLSNMEKLDVDINKIEMVVISHDHWDHTGGLWEILKIRKGLEVYACPHFSRGFKEKVKKLQGELVKADRFIEISKDIFTSGEISGYIPEQALAIKTENGITVITGCAHPGIVKMVEKVKEKFPKEQLYLVFGGFHLMDKDKREIEITVESFKKMKIKKVGPTHCTGKEAEEIFKKEYKDNFVSIKAGQIIEI